MAKEVSHWLVKSGGRVLGPMTTEEIGKALKSKEIVPLDEIALSFGRWHYIRDERVFDSVVSELRKLKGAGDATQTNTDADTQTDTLTDVTERISAFGSTDKLTESISSQIREGRSERVVQESSSRSSESTYGYAGDKEFVRNSLKARANLFLWLTLFIVVGGISLKVISIKSQQTPLNRGMDTLLHDAKQEESIGNYGDALQLYKQAVDLNDKNTDATLGYGFRLLKVNQTVEAKQIFEKTMSNTQDPNLKSQAYLGLALSALQTDNYTVARTEAEKGLALNSSNGYLNVVTGTVYMSESKPLEAAKEFRAAVEKGTVNQLVSLMLAEAEYISARNDVSPDGYKNALEVLNNIIKIGAAYTQEALALKINVLIESKQVAELEPMSTLLLDMDPRLTEDHVEDPRLPTERMDWDHLTRYLKRSIADVPSTPRLTTVLGLSMFKGREKLEGKRVIEDALAKASDDKLIRSILSYVQFLVGRDEEAQAGLTIAQEAKSIRLPTILRARSCRERKDYICSEEQWKELLGREPRSLSAIGGLAWTYLDKGLNKDAESYVDRGLGLSPTYSPLLKAKALLKRK